MAAPLANSGETWRQWVCPAPASRRRTRWTPPRFEQRFSWVKTYAHELREAAETLEQEGNLFQKHAARRPLMEKGPQQALAVLEAVGRPIEAIKGKVKELDEASGARQGPRPLTPYSPPQPLNR